jgi:hypothetical protein
LGQIVATAESNCGVLAGLGIPDLGGQEDEEEAAEVETPSPAIDPTQKPEKRGRKGTGLGKSLFPNTLGPDDAAGAGVHVNPRRKGSHGYNSLQIVIDNPGILTEDYLSKGGRLNDLRWDIAHGNVKMED